MSKMNKWLLSSGLLGLLLTLSGCVSTNSDGTPNENGMIYRFLVKPLGNLITMLVENFDWSYGWAIIAVTIVVRLIILPLGIHQSKKTMIQSEKMQFLKPQVDIAQANLKKATTREEQMQAQADMQKIYSEFGILWDFLRTTKFPICSHCWYFVSHTRIYFNHWNPRRTEKNDENNVDRFAIDDCLHVIKCTCWCNVILGCRRGLQLPANLYYKCHHET